MSKMLAMLRAAMVSLFSLVCIFVLGAPLLVYAVLSRDTDPLYNVGRICGRAVLWLSGVKLDVHGREKIPASRAVVFMPNHQSNCDPPAIFVLLPPTLVMGKREFFRVPILGRAMRMRGFIPLTRNRSRAEAIAVVKQAAAALRAGHNFLAFPEGTRSTDGRLLPFKKGVFLMALEAGAPIIPISLSGSRHIMRKGEFAVYPGTVRVTFHDPVETRGRSIADLSALMEEVRRAMLSGLTEEEWPLPSPAAVADRVG
jgi:1-acyl-sn-glycerol-3-phosphate acyltransferase